MAQGEWELLGISQASYSIYTPSCLAWWLSYNWLNLSGLQLTRLYTILPQPTSPGAFRTLSSMLSLQPATSQLNQRVFRTGSLGTGTLGPDHAGELQLLCSLFPRWRDEETSAIEAQGRGENGSQARLPGEEEQGTLTLTLGVEKQDFSDCGWSSGDWVGWQTPLVP